MVGGQGYQLSAEQQLAAAKPKAFKVASLKGRQPKALGLGLGVVRPRGAEPQVRPSTDPFLLRKMSDGVLTRACMSSGGSREWGEEGQAGRAGSGSSAGG